MECQPERGVEARLLANGLELEEVAQEEELHLMVKVTILKEVEERIPEI